MWCQYYKASIWNWRDKKWLKEFCIITLFNGNDYITILLEFNFKRAKEKEKTFQLSKFRLFEKGLVNIEDFVIKENEFSHLFESESIHTLAQFRLNTLVNCSIFSNKRLTQIFKQIKKE